MGEYFGLINFTKTHKISHYWKSSPPTIKELHKIAQFYGWNLQNDDIRSFSYCTNYIYLFDMNEWLDDSYVSYYDEYCQDNEEGKTDENDWLENGVDFDRNGDIYEQRFNKIYFCN